MKHSVRFYLLGLLLAGAEEFVTQGVLKGTYGGWILPTVIAFLPFLLLLRFARALLDRLLPEPASVLSYYLLAGSAGLLVEWFVIGLSPWRDPLAPIPAVVAFHAGMFSFWGAVALVPRILTDSRELTARLRDRVRRWTVAGFLVIYFLTFTVPGSWRFGVVIISVLALFTGLNICHYQYMEALRRPSHTPPPTAPASNPAD